MSKFTESVEHYLDGLEYVSTGACPGCDGCDLSENQSEDWEAISLAEEPYFSWGSCDSCGSTFGGDRHPAHALLDDEIYHLAVCTDCLLYLANGEEPEEWYRTPSEYRETQEV